MENFGKWIYGVHQIIVLGMNTEGLNKREPVVKIKRLQICNK